MERRDRLPCCNASVKRRIEQTQRSSGRVEALLGATSLADIQFTNSVLERVTQTRLLAALHSHATTAMPSAVRILLREVAHAHGLSLDFEFFSYKLQLQYVIR